MELAAAQNNATFAPPPTSTPLHSRRPWLVINGQNNNEDTQQTDELKDFNHALAVQASSEQIKAYNSMMQSSEAANQNLQALAEQLEKKINAAEISHASHSLNQSVEAARTQTKQFIEAFSKSQQLGLRETIAKVTRADLEVGQQMSKLGHETEQVNSVAPEISSDAQSLDQALKTLRRQQIGMGDEMGISEDSAFNLSPTSSSINVDDTPIPVTVSGTIRRVAVESNQSVFNLQLTTDLSGLQQNITEILRYRVNKQPLCGVRRSLRRATFAASDPVSMVIAQLHLERWGCFGMAGQTTASELAEADGTLTVKLAAALTQNGTLQLVPEIGSIDATGWAADQLRSEELETQLRNEIADPVLAAIRTATDFKTTLPELAQQSATINKAEFYEAGGVHIVMNGTIRISDEQLKVIGSHSTDPSLQGSLR